MLQWKFKRILLYLLVIIICLFIIGNIGLLLVEFGIIPLSSLSLVNILIGAEDETECLIVSDLHQDYQDLGNITEQEAYYNYTEADCEYLKSNVGRAFIKSYFSKKPEQVVKFFAYNNISSEVTLDNVDSFKNVNVPENTTLKILIHGFRNKYNSSFNLNLTQAYLEHTNNPVIRIDWSEMAGKWKVDSPQYKLIPEKLLYYGIVKINIPLVANYITEFIQKLKENQVITSLSQVHLLGYSLGAHISGRVGSSLQEKLPGEKIGRITGLDPAGPLFRKKDMKYRLDESDASFVDIYHTSHDLGDRRATGHVDFYPNSDSEMQPGCPKSLFSFLSFFHDQCNHQSAVRYFVNSIRNQESHHGCQLLSQDSTKKIRQCSETCDPSVVYGEYLSFRFPGQYCLVMSNE